ncbi:MAG TPA: HD domain-containing phosphohydrolase [Thermoanaerobaculia bacterium]|jgi:MFS family permease|nr:HD domain-containing phosphohydrolase [Thermoanaerobaculia bacterium]
MSVVEHQPRAAPASRAAFAYHRTGRLAKWLGRGRGARLAFSLAAGLLGELLTGWSGGLLFPLTPAVSLTAGLLFGGLGIAGAAVGQLAAVFILHRNLLDALIFAAAFSMTGLAGWAVFRWTPKLGRGLPNLRSFLATLAAAFAGGAAGALLTLLLSRRLLPAGETAGAWTWTWMTGALVSVALLAPPVLLAFNRYGRRWMVTFPRELLVTDHRLERSIPGSGEETLILSSPEPVSMANRRDLLLGTGMVLAAAAVALVLVWKLPQGSGWATLLYLLPILWAALHYGLRGGILAASGSGVCHLLGLVGIAVLLGSTGLGKEVWAGRADLLILSIAGALVGWSRDREVRLREELIESNRLLRRDLVRISDALMQAVEAKDAYTGGHLRRVSEYAVAVGEKLGLRGRDLETLHYASLLHDVGKLGVPESVLRKEGPLDAGETEMMRRHPEIGARMLERLELLRGAAPLVLHHQERFDGNLGGQHPGYPRGLAGEDIPLGARIIAVVDAFDAMTTTRPYRPALPAAEAAAVLRRERGRQFDPRAVDAFLDCLAERPWRI